MQNYRIDFSMNREHEMTIGREQGIYRNELDEIELNMLHSQTIPYLLPLDWFELDGEVTFRYTLTGKKMLLHRLQQQPLAMKQYYMLLLGVTDALNECKHYMLRPEGCLLDEKFIFIGEQLHDIRLAYIPMKKVSGESALGAEDLLSLIVRFTSYIDQIDGDGLKRVLQHLTGKKWPLVELRETLLDLIGGDEPLQSPRLEESLLDLTQKQNLEPMPRSTSRIQPSIQNFSPPAPSDEVIAVHRTLADIPFVDELDEEERDVKRNWIFTAVLFVMIACVWRFIYLAEAARHTLLISAGITLLLLAALLFIWRKGTGKHTASEEDSIENEQKPFHSETFPKQHYNMYEEIESNEANQISDGKLNEDEFRLSSLSTLPSMHVAAANFVMPAAEPTVLLGRKQELEGTSKGTAWLQRCWEGQETRIELLEQDCFKIGRTGEQVSYADQANGVSRIHLEIEHSNGEHKAKDLGSRNGSLLNGKTMIPYKSYNLAMGDIIHLAGVDGPKYELRSS
ncbi:hypothetical protein FHS15_001403 [Paenibacillus castaneae]|uniref:DUF6382 domain-containing protein n=1 Tax=Paenibacillus castaneae TaxID=474957 RepID=UPI000C9B2CAD|nr:DUF6382 domain-containing protein [Paenibacillus castaneae]NIK76296.1 hypothetical protein [Paenibacillus castaneae]